MEINIKVKIKPFSTPNFVIREGDPDGANSIPITDIDVDTLERLCWEFKVEIFKKAGKQMLPTIRGE